MRLHPRTLPVQKAAANIRTELGELQDIHDLTNVEMLGILLEIAGHYTKYVLRAERHPDDPDRKADEA